MAATAGLAEVVDGRIDRFIAGVRGSICEYLAGPFGTLGGSFWSRVRSHFCGLGCLAGGTVADIGFYLVLIAASLQHSPLHPLLELSPSTHP